MIKRLAQTVKNYRNMGDIINRRAKVELYLWDVYFGTKLLPDAEKCKELALDLGIPSHLRHQKK